MLKKDSFNKVSLGMSCSDCVHFQTGPAKFEKVCAEIGVDARSRAPDCYNPDVFKLKDTDDPELLKNLGNIIRKFSPKQARILSFLLARQGGQLAKVKLKFGQPVYFSLGADYVSHYFKGYVVSSSEDHVYVVAKLNKAKENTSLTLLRTSILTWSEYKKLEATLLEEGKVYMSEQERKKQAKLPIAELLDKKGRVPHVEQFKIDYEPPTLDTAPADWLNIYDASGEAKRKKKKKPKGVFFNSEDRSKPFVIESNRKKFAKSKEKSW